MWGLADLSPILYDYKKLPSLVRPCRQITTKYVAWPTLRDAKCHLCIHEDWLIYELIKWAPKHSISWAKPRWGDCRLYYILCTVDTNSIILDYKSIFITFCSVLSFIHHACQYTYLSINFNKKIVYIYYFDAYFLFGQDVFEVLHLEIFFQDLDWCLFSTLKLWHICLSQPFGLFSSSLCLCALALIVR